MVNKMQQVVKLINERSSWYSLKAEFENIFPQQTYKELLDYFEEKIDEIPKNKTPQYCLLFYIVLLILHEDRDIDNELAEYAKSQKSYHYMKIGMKLYVQAKSPNFRYRVDLSTDNYTNKYEFIHRFIDMLFDVDMKLEGFFLILTLIYKTEKETFLSFLKEDKQSILFLGFMLRGTIDLPYRDLLPFLRAEDELKANGALYYLMNRFDSLSYKINYQRSKETEKKLFDEVKEIESIFKQLPQERKLDLIVNYMFEKSVYPSFFMEELLLANTDLFIRTIEKKGLTNMYKLIKLHEFIIHLNNNELNTLFLKYFIEWVKEDSNRYVWENVRQTVFEVIDHLTTENKNDLFTELVSVRNTLFLTSFDKQVRFPMFLREEDKIMVIEEVLQLEK